MASDPNEASSDTRPTCEAFGIRRIQHEVCSENATFLSEFLEKDSLWTEWELKLEKQEYGHILLYSTSVSSGGYVTHEAWLTVGRGDKVKRATEMKGRDMIVDNWIAAGGNLRDLKCIGTSNIINQDAIYAAEAEFALQNKDWWQGGQVELIPTDALYNTCVMTSPFIGGLDKLAKSLGRRIKRFVFISREERADNAPPIDYREMEGGSPYWDLVMEMTDPDEPDSIEPGRPLNLTPMHEGYLEFLSLYQWLRWRCREIDEEYSRIEIELRKLLWLICHELDWDDDDEDEEEEEDDDDDNNGDDNGDDNGDGDDGDDDKKGEKDEGSPSGKSSGDIEMGEAGDEEEEEGEEEEEMADDNEIGDDDVEMKDVEDENEDDIE